MLNKKLKTATHEIRLNDGEMLRIKLPANYRIIFESVRNGTANYPTVKLYNDFIEKYRNLHELEKIKFRHFANSGKFRTDEICDLISILDIMRNYICGVNIQNFEELGREYASMYNLKYVGDKNVNMKQKYQELGKYVCEAHDGFFAEGCFYGKMLDSNNI